MIRKCLDVKLNVKPVFINFAHKYYYEGPCRMSGGETLVPGFDSMMNAQSVQRDVAGYKEMFPDFINLLEPSVVEVTCDWDNKEEYYETLFCDDHKTDVYLLNYNFGADAVIQEFARRCKKPIFLLPNEWALTRAAMFYNFGVDVTIELAWEDTIKQFAARRAKKAIELANLLLVVRFNYDLPKAGATDSFPNLVDVTDKLGVRFRTVNLHEILDEFSPLPEGGNPTTPGRVTPNITEEELKEIGAAADELLAGTNDSTIERKYVINSLIANRVIRKNMDLYDCSGVVIPCPDVCSTRKMNEMKFTFCLNHSLNLEEGIPSACEYDVAAAVTMLAEIVISGKAPYMGNTLPLVFDETFGGLRPYIAPFMDDCDVNSIEDKDNLYFVYHSTPNRKFKGIDQPAEPYALRHFAYDQKFGACMRRDFNSDIGQKITMARFSGDLKKLFIGRGEIVKGFGYKKENCNGGFIFRVEDKRTFSKAQSHFGLHLPIVFGDYTKELQMLAEMYGMEAIIV